MDYKAFALAYRPQNFDEVVGQDVVVNSLKTAISTNRVSHAYMFSGPRGVGKTSLARIFAKSLNCEKGPSPAPCGVCSSCVAITQGTSLDVMEIDGASNRGIDEIRELRESTKLSSTSSRFKIYIIDEIHMLTTEAFNALLKTLEEPPAHVKFFFATTHPHKVLPTILSRCQKLQLNLVPMEKIADKLKKIIKAEKVKIDDTLIYSVARAATGSIRDAESLLDQLVPVVLSSGDSSEVLAFLGILDETVLNRAIEALVNKDVAVSLAIVDKIAKDGKDLGVFLTGLIEQVRNVILAKVSSKSFKELSDVPQASKDFFLQLAQATTTKQLLEVADVLMFAKEQSHKINSVRIPLELAIVKFSCKDIVEIAPSSKPGVSQPAPAKDQARTVAQQLKDEFELEMDNLDLEEKTKVAVTKSDEGDTHEEGIEDNILLTQVRQRWPEITMKLQKIKAALASYLTFSKLISSSGPLLNIGFVKKDYFHKEQLEVEKNRMFVEKFISDIIGKKVAIKFVLIQDSLNSGKDAKPAVKNIPPAAKQNDNDVPGDDDFVNDILDSFNGKLHTN